MLFPVSSISNNHTNSLDKLPTNTFSCFKEDVLFFFSRWNCLSFGAGLQLPDDIAYFFTDMRVKSEQLLSMSTSGFVNPTYELTAGRSCSLYGEPEDIQLDDDVMKDIQQKGNFQGSGWPVFYAMLER